jgi:hypothetical protein
LNTKRKALADAINKMVKAGTITAAQAKTLINRVNKVNLDNPAMVEDLLDYADKVFENADYAEKINTVSNQLPTAKKNVKTKIGVSEVLTPLLERLFNMKPTLIPMSVFEEYLSIVDMIGKRQTELSLQESQKLTARVKNILEDIDNELSTLDILIDIFNEFDGKVINENDNIDFSNTLNAMVDKKVITSEDADLLKKYKSQVIEKTSEPKMTE